MLNHYFKFFIRNFIRQKGFSIINVTGLSIGMAVSILILLYVFHELSYDRFISNVDNKYSVNFILEYSGGRYEADRSCGELVPVSLEKFPEVTNAVSLYDESPLVRYEDKFFTENGGDIYFAQETVFKFFDLKIIAGNPEAVFNEPFSVALSQDKAVKYFGQEDPLGRVVTFQDKFPMKVTAVFANYPENSHLQFGMVAPIEAFLKIKGISDLTEYGNSGLTYLELMDGTDQEALCRKLEEASYSFVPQKLREQMNITLTHYLNPVKRIHLYVDFGKLGEDSGPGRIVYVYIFSAIAIFILLLACVNFMNLATARYAGRAKEVGLRKIIGASKSVLRKQFFGESLFLSFIALFTAVVMAELFLPVFNNLIDKKLSLIYNGNLQLIIGLVILGIVVGFLSGSYPAIFLTSFKPLSVMKGKLKSGRGSKYFRWSLVVFQFIIALVLTTCTLVILLQMNYIRKKDLGFQRDNLLVVALSGEQIRNNLDDFGAGLEKIPGITGYTFTSDKPGVSTNWYNLYIYEDREDEEHPAFATVDIDDRFIGTVGLQLVKGRNFSAAIASDSAAMILNESMVKYLGWEDPIGKSVFELTEQFDRKKYTIIGVIRDFHMESLHRSIGPLMFSMTDRKRYGLVRVHPENMERTIAAIEETWNSISPSRPFSYHHLSNSYDWEYRSEKKLGDIFVYFTIFAILIAGLGVVGLVSFITVGRTKEIGIRKVLGSGAGDVVRIISLDFLKMVTIAIIIASPVAWYIMDQWLDRFAYSINISFWVFILTGLFGILLIVLSTAYQAMKAAWMNPVEAIRYE